MAKAMQSTIETMGSRLMRWMRLEAMFGGRQDESRKCGALIALTADPQTHLLRQLHILHRREQARLHLVGLAVVEVRQRGRGPSKVQDAAQTANQRPRRHVRR
jgi:hypothetical protein